MLKKMLTKKLKACIKDIEQAKCLIRAPRKADTPFPAALAVVPQGISAG